MHTSSEMFRDTVYIHSTDREQKGTASKLHLCYRQTDGLMEGKCIDHLNNLSATAKL